MGRQLRPRLPIVLAVLGILACTMPPGGGRNELQQLPFGEIASVIAHPGDLGDTFDVIANVLLFMPLGAALRHASSLSLRRATGFGAVLSASIELVQLAIPGRWTSIDDWMLNTLGTALGYLVWRMLRQRPAAEHNESACLY